MTRYLNWFEIHDISNPKYGACAVSFDPTALIYPEAEAYRQRMIAATGQKEPLYNGYDWAMMFTNYLQADHPNFRTRASESPVEIFGSTEGITAPCDSREIAQSLIEKCAALLADEPRVAQMIKDGLAVD